MPFMSVTFEVLRGLTSREVKYRQPPNIYFMVVTFSVLKPLRSMFLNDLQFVNIYLMSVTELVFKYLIPVMEMIFSIPRNQL